MAAAPPNPPADDLGRVHASRHEGPGGGSIDWDEWYSMSEQTWSGRPNGALVSEVVSLSPGTALDVGCGEGADAIWLASRGWVVTAVDLSQVALERARQAARRADVEIAFELTELRESWLPAEGFDLVSAQYPALPRTVAREAERALLAAVGPGGHLIVVHHAHVDHGAAAAHGVDRCEYMSPEDVSSLFDDDWTILVDETRSRHVTSGAGAGHSQDLVLHAVRGR